jgi:uncharacterized MAPEG superfamily protein
MTLELKMLALSVVLGLVQIVLASHAASLQRGYVWTASSRDDPVPALTGVAGRMARARAWFDGRSHFCVIFNEWITTIRVRTL